MLRELAGEIRVLVTVLVGIVGWIAGLGRVESRRFGIARVEAELGRADGAVDSGARGVGSVASGSRCNVRRGGILATLCEYLDHAADRVRPVQSAQLAGDHFYSFDLAERNVLERRAAQGRRVHFHAVDEHERLIAVRPPHENAARLPGSTVAADFHPPRAFAAPRRGSAGRSGRYPRP